MAFIKEEIEDVKIEETFRVKHEETEEQIKKEESEDIKTEETFSVKQQTDLMPLIEDSQDLNEMEEKDQYETNDFITKEKSCSCSQAKRTSSRKRAQKTGTIGKFTCHLCGFKKDRNLEVHMRVHTSKKLYSCQQCGVSFSQQGNLRVHMRMHTGEKPFTCSQCGKSFSVRGNLNVHMRIHTGEKPYTCPQCGVHFSQKTHLKSHIRIHTGEKLFTCQQCGKSVSRKGHLKRHLRTHMGKRFKARKIKNAKCVTSNILLENI